MDILYTVATRRRDARFDFVSDAECELEGTSVEAVAVGAHIARVSHLVFHVVP